MKKETVANESTSPMISVKEWANYNSVSPMTVYRALKAGQIPGAIKVRAQWRIPADGRATVRLPTINGISEEWVGMPRNLTINGVLFVRADTLR